MPTVLLVALIIAGVVLLCAALWFLVFRPMFRRTSEWVTSFTEETRLTGERIIRPPEPASYSGGTKPHSAVRGNGRIALTQRRLVFRKLTGPVEEVLIASITGTRRAAWFRGERRGRRLHLVVETVDAGEIGFLVRDLDAWEHAITQLRQPTRS